MRCRIPIVTFLLLFLFSTFGDIQLPNDDFSIVRQRVLEFMIWPAKENISDTVKSALLLAETLNSSCYWPNINYTDQGLAEWRTVQHLYRTTLMLQAATVPGSTVQNNTRLLSLVHCALNVWLVHDWQNPNWWFNQIDVPLQTTTQLLMLGNNVTSYEIDRITEISYRADWWRQSYYTGDNLVSMIKVELYRSLSTYNITGIEQGFTRLWKDLVILPLGGQGVQSDWSYHYHGEVLLSGMYGQEWANNMLLFVLCSQKTQYEVDQQHLSILTDFLTKGDAWMIIGNGWDWNTFGRSIGDPSHSYLFMIESNLIRSLAQLIESNNSRIDLLNLADRLDGRSNASLLIGNKHFYTSDYQVHRRANWTSTIKMQSIRTTPTECILDENQKAEHLGQGILNLYTTNNNDYIHIFPLLDWQAINGITVEHDIPLEPCINGHFLWKNVSFVGGVSDGSYGLAMMDTATHNLTAKRSWHFYDDAIIALASNITLTTSNTVWTTLASRLLPKGNITIAFINTTIITLSNGNYSFPYVNNSTSNVQWLHIGQTGIGYILQVQGQYSALGMEIYRKKGNYDTFGPHHLTVIERMLTIWIDHGLGPFSLDYRYIIVPNVTVESMPSLVKRYDDEQIFSCISTSNFFHGTMWPSLKRISFVLWDNITTHFSCQSPSYQITVQLTDAGAYLFTETDTDFSITASHPIRVNGTVTVIIDRIGHGKGCKTSLDNSTNVTLTLPSSPQLLGASVIVTCNKKNKFN